MSTTLIYILVVVGISVAKGVMDLYQKKKAIAEQERQRRDFEQESLRTGRDPVAEAAQAQARAQQAAMQREAARQQALREEREEALRRLREQGGSARELPPPQPQQTGGPITRELWPGGPVIVIGGPVPAPSSAPAPRQQPAQRPQPVGRSQAEQQRSRQQRQTAQQRADQERGGVNRSQPVPQRAKQPQQVRAVRDEIDESRVRPVVRTEPRTRKAPAQPLFKAPQTPAQWRAAFIAAEVLGPPAAFRPTGHSF